MTNHPSSPDIGKFMLAESRYRNSAQDIGILFYCPWFKVRLDVKFIGLCKIIELYPLCLPAFDGGAELSKGTMRIP